MTQLSDTEYSTYALPATREPISVGRSEECHIHIDDQSVSELHAYLYIGDKSIRMSHIASDSESFVNLQKAVKASIHPGDVFEFGEAYFLLHYC